MPKLSGKLSADALDFFRACAASRERVSKPCAYCGSPMENVIKKRVYCSDSCRYQAWADRQAEDDEENE